MLRDHNFHRAHTFARVPCKDLPDWLDAVQSLQCTLTLPLKLMDASENVTSSSSEGNSLERPHIKKDIHGPTSALEKGPPAKVTLGSVVASPKGKDRLAASIEKAQRFLRES